MSSVVVKIVVGISDRAPFSPLDDTPVSPDFRIASETQAIHALDGEPLAPVDGHRIRYESLRRLSHKLVRQSVAAEASLPA